MSKSTAGTRVQVAVRIRPLNRSDGADERVAVRVDPNDPKGITVDERRNRNFSYDHVFCGGQEEVYSAIGTPMLEEAYKGFNVCLFAYGQTGSGKTYSIQGEDGEDKQGIVPRFVRDVFQQAQRRVEDDPDITIKISMSMIEIYMEKVRDLLVERTRGQEPGSLEIHEDQNRRVYVKNVSVHSVLGAERVLELLKFGNSNRQTAETRMNEASSRSHSIVQLTISQLFGAVDRKDTESLVSLVDLAGSERQGKTETTGQQFEEAKKINQSLLMLGRALNSFSDGRNDFISLRESKLTRLLSESFGGNSKTWMLATISPSQFNLVESLSTLEYALNAKAITNRAEVNRLEKQLELSDLKELAKKLEASLQGKRDELEQVNGTARQLQKEIADLRTELEGIVDETSTNQQRIAHAVLEQDYLREELRKSLRFVGGVGRQAFQVICSTSICDPDADGLTLSLRLPLECEPAPLLLLRVKRIDRPGIVSFEVRIVEALHFPSYATGGAQVALWFEGFENSKVTSPIVSSKNRNPQFNFSQPFVFGRRTETSLEFLRRESLKLSLCGFL